MNTAHAGPLDAIPLWLMFVLTVGITQFAVEAGFRLGAFRRQSAEPEKDAPVGAIVGATLGLLAFMLAFTFSLAASRFEARRQVILDEANAIGTTYLRAGTLPPPHGETIRTLLREYVDVRLQALQSGEIQAAMTRSAELHDQLWHNAQAAAANEPSAITAIFLTSLNDVIDLHATRVHAGLRSRIPAIIWAALFFVAFFAMLVLGYQVGLSNAKRSIAAVALVLTFSAVMLLIADLDRPGAGMLQTSQQALVDLADSIKASK
jgi:hypothetical protein